MNAKNVTRLLKQWSIWALLLGAGLAQPARVFAHCDGMDGPVVQAAQKALESRNVNLVLIWVPKADEREVKELFPKVLNVRKLTPEARELADRYFFETLVRVHRAGEGAPYTGLKPAGRDLGPIIPAADRAIDSRRVEPLLRLLPQQARQRAGQLFQDVLEKKSYDPNDVEAGRQYVRAYVRFMHELEELGGRAVHEHQPKAGEHQDHGHQSHQN